MDLSTYMDYVRELSTKDSFVYIDQYLKKMCEKFSSEAYPYIDQFVACGANQIRLTYVNGATPSVVHTTLLRQYVDYYIEFQKEQVQLRNNIKKDASGTRHNIIDELSEGDRKIDKLYKLLENNNTMTQDALKELNIAKNDLVRVRTEYIKQTLKNVNLKAHDLQVDLGNLTSITNLLADAVKCKDNK